MKNKNNKVLKDCVNGIKIYTAKIERNKNTI